MGSHKNSSYGLKILTYIYGFTFLIIKSLVVKGYHKRLPSVWPGFESRLTNFLISSAIFLDSPDQGLPIVLILESLYTKLNVLDQLPFSQTHLEV
jgi:hypothetical protein